jgi:hypothetical protein
MRLPTAAAICSVVPRARDHRHREHERLRQRPEQLRHRLAVQAVVPNVADDADDLHRFVLAGAAAPDDHVCRLRPTATRKNWRAIVSLISATGVDA